MIDLNCDVGEAYGAWVVGSDEALIPLVTSANIACGFHAGDPGVIRATVRIARYHGVAIGAHPGYPDLQGFGRRAMALTPAEIEDIVLYQIGAVAAFARAAGATLAHVKPHGALYNRAARDRQAADAIARAVFGFDRDLILVGLAGSALVEAGKGIGLPVAREAFADRGYEADGSLRARDLPGALLQSVDAVVEQAISLARDGCVQAVTGERVSIDADTLCLHGDTPGALEFARAVRAGLEQTGITVCHLAEALTRRRGV